MGFLHLEGEKFISLLEHFIAFTAWLVLQIIECSKRPCSGVDAYSRGRLIQLSYNRWALNQWITVNIEYRN